MQTPAQHFKYVVNWEVEIYAAPNDVAFEHLWSEIRYHLDEIAGMCRMTYKRRFSSPNNGYKFQHRICNWVGKIA